MSGRRNWSLGETTVAFSVLQVFKRFINEMVPKVRIPRLSFSSVIYTCTFLNQHLDDVSARAKNFLLFLLVGN